MLGVLLVDKPLGITSHDVVNEVRRRFGTRRVGHAGTLDPLAEGVLVVAVGPATRFLQYLPLEPKEYVADITFGRATDSYDREGDVVSEAPIPEDLHALIDQALPKFSGLISQLPPMYSAVKVKGKALYHYARQGEQLERTPRTVHITTYEILERGEDSIKARIVCSGGTYIRSLAHDLGVELGCGAYLSGLARTAVGRFKREDAIPLSETRPEHLVPLAEALPPMPLIQLDDEQVRSIREGRPLRVEDPPESFLVALLDPTGLVVSVARVQGNVLRPECVIPAEAKF